MSFLIKKHFLDVNNACSKLLSLTLKSYPSSSFLSTAAAATSVRPAETDQDREHIKSNFVLSKIFEICHFYKFVKFI